MKFKSYLQLNEYTSRKLSELISKQMIPLVPTMMDRLGYYWEDVDAYHVTNIKHLASMVKQQKKNVHISTFSRGGPELARLPSQPNVLLTLNGDEVISGNSDIWSLVDTEGRRWLDIKSDEGGKKLHNYLVGVYEKTLKNLGHNVDIDISKLTGKEKNLVYKDYINNVEKFLETGGYKYLSKYLGELNKFGYNEIILTKWNIEGIHSIQSESQQLKDFCAKNNITYLGVIPRRNLSKLEI